MFQSNDISYTMEPCHSKPLSGSYFTIATKIPGTLRLIDSYSTLKLTLKSSLRSMCMSPTFVSSSVAGIARLHCTTFQILFIYACMVV